MPSSFRIILVFLLHKCNRLFVEYESKEQSRRIDQRTVNSVLYLSISVKTIDFRAPLSTQKARIGSERVVLASVQLVLGREERMTGNGANETAERNEKGRKVYLKVFLPRSWTCPSCQTIPRLFCNFTADIGYYEPFARLDSFPEMITNMHGNASLPIFPDIEKKSRDEPGNIEDP